MNGALQVTVDLDAGEVRLGPHRVRLLPPMSDRPSRASSEVFHLNDLRGPLVRALFFEERSLLLTSAPESEIARRIAEAALVAPGRAPDPIRIAVSLALAGGAEEAPSFSDCAMLAAQQEGWDCNRVSEAAALLVDRVCGKQRPQVPDDGWKRIIFQEPEADLETLVSMMVENLSRRSGSAAVDNPERESSATPDESENTSGRSQPRPWRSVEVEDQSLEHRAAAIAVEPHGVPGSQPASSVSTIERRRIELTAPYSASSSAPGPISIAATTAGSLSRGPAGTRDASPRPAFSRVPARVLALNHDYSLRPHAATLPSTANTCGPTEKSRIGYSTPDHVQPTTISTGAPTAKQVSLSFSPVASSAPERSEAAFQSVAFSPAKRSFPPLLPEAEAPRAPSQTESRGLSSSFSGWLSEVAALLEAECDLRGIDP